VSEDTTKQVRELVDDVYRAESRQVLATLIRLLGDFDAAEEALHDAFAVAVERWSRDGVPNNPRAWLVSTGRFKAIDGMRRRARFDASLPELAKQLESTASGAEEWSDDESVEDDRLRLVFTCCHPALAPDAQVAMTLREVCGLTTDEIARAFLTKPPTVAQRIVRAKAKIRDAGIPYVVPSETDLPDRLEAVLRVVYLVFNEGYSASSGGSLTRHDLSGEAIRLGRLLIQLLPEPEAEGLLALMLLQDSRRAARTTATGRPGSLTVESRADHRGGVAGGTGAIVAPHRTVHRSGRDRGGACPGAECGRHGLGSDRRPLRCVDTHRSLTRDRAEPRGGRGDARRSCGGPGSHRCHPRSGRSGELSPGACGAGRLMQATGTNTRSPCLLRTRPSPHTAGTGTALS
jgi:RNA polymerase sigma factor (sigma-70 family)